MTTRVEEAVTVNVPAAVAYDLCTHVEEFPRFLPHVARVEHHDHARFSISTRNGSRTRHWETEIVERTPGSRIVWRCAGGTPHAGVVTFRQLSAGRCRVAVRIEYQPPGMRERNGKAGGMQQGRIAKDLRSFAEYLELRAVDLRP